MNKDFLFYFLGYCFLNPLLILLLSSNQILCLISCAIQIFILCFSSKSLFWDYRNLEIEEFGISLIETLIFQFIQAMIVAIITYLQRRTNQLSNRLSEKSVSLNKSYQKKYIHCFSFEIRDSLNSLSGSLQIINSKGISTNDSEMLKIAKISAEKIHRLFNNMIDLFELDSNIPGIVFNSADTYSFFKNIWKIAAGSIQNRTQQGSLKFFGRIPNIIKIDLHRTKQLILNFAEFMTQGNNYRKFDIKIEWLNQDIKSLVLNELDTNKELFEGFSISKSDTFGKNLREAQSQEIRNFASKNKEDIEGVLKIDFIGIDLLRRVEEINSEKTRFSYKKEDSKSTTELGFDAALKICKILGGYIIWDLKNELTIFTVYLPSFVSKDNDLFKDL